MNETPAGACILYRMAALHGGYSAGLRLGSNPEICIQGLYDSELLTCWTSVTFWVKKTHDNST